MEEGVCRVELAAKVGDQVRREEEPEAGLREEADRGRMAVQETSLDPPPVLQFFERTNLVVRLATFETALQETRSRKRVGRESGFDLLHNGFSIAHADSPRVAGRRTRIVDHPRGRFPPSEDGFICRGSLLSRSRRMGGVGLNPHPERAVIHVLVSLSTENSPNIPSTVRLRSSSAATRKRRIVLS